MKTFYNNTKENDDWTRSIHRGGSKGEGMGRGEPQRIILRGKPVITLVPKPNDSAMIAFDLALDERFADMSLKVPGAVEDFHMTLLFLGPAKDLDVTACLHQLAQFAKKQRPFVGKIGGVATFVPDDKGKYPIVALIDSPELPTFHQSLVEEMDDFLPKQDHGFTPHVTLGYSNKPMNPIQRGGEGSGNFDDDGMRGIGEGMGRGETQQAPPNEIEFSTIWLVVGDEKFPFRLGGVSNNKAIPK